MIQNFVVDPSSVSRDAILADLKAYLDSVPDSDKWKDFFKSSTGETVLELIAGFGAFLTYNAISARREAFWQNAVNRSSVIGGAQSLGYSSFRGRNAVLNLNITPVVTGVIDKYAIVGSIGDQDLILLEDTIVNTGTPTTMVVVVGTLQSESITVNTNGLASFRFTTDGVSEDFRVKLNDVEVPSSERILDLLNQKFVAQSNPLGSMDVKYLNLSSFTIQYQVGDILSLEWIATNNITIDTTQVIFDYGTLNTVSINTAFQDVESLDGIKINASLFNETQFIIRGRNDYLKDFRLLDASLVDTSGTDISPAVVELSYVKSDYSLYLPLELASLESQLEAIRPFGVQPPLIAHPRIVFLDVNVKVVPLPNTAGNATNAVNTAIDPYQQVLGAAIDFEQVEYQIDHSTNTAGDQYIKISRVTVDAKAWSSFTTHFRGQHLAPTTNTGLIYEITDFIYRSGATEPSWTCTDGDLINDYQLLWKVETKGICDNPPLWSANTRYKIGDIVQSNTLCPGKMFVVVRYINLSNSSEENQKITFSSLPASGTWRIEFNSEQTADLSFNANASAIQAALNSLNSLSSVVVSGDYINGFTIDFAGADANQSQPLCTFNSLGVSEIQCLEFSANPNAGTFKLEFNGQQTGDLPSTISASQLQTALEALSSVGAGNVLVSGNFGNNFNLNFQNSLSHEPLPEIVLVNSSLTQANSVTSNVSTLQDGVPASVGTDEVQLITFDKLPQAGNFVINFNQQVTGNIAYNATASDIQTALQAISTVGAGNALVTGDFINGFSVQFTAGLGHQDVVQIFIPSDTLVKFQAVSPAVTVAQVGGSGHNEIEKISFDYIPDSGTWRISFTYGGQAESTQIQVAADLGGLLNNKYWFFSTVTTDYYVWYNVNGAGVDPAIGGRTGIQVNLATNDTANTVNTNTISAINTVASANVTAISLSTDILKITNTAQGAVTHASSQTSGFSPTVIIPGVNPTWTTSNLSSSINFTQLQTALEALPNIGAGNVQVTGDFINGFIVTFLNALANLNLPVLQITNNSLIQTQVVNVNVQTMIQGVPPNAGQDEIQKIAFDSVPDSGTWQLNFNGDPTSTLQFNDTASTIQTALNSLPSLGGVVVTGDYTIGFTVTFTGIDALTNEPALIVTNSTLFSNSIPVTVTPCLVTDGAYPAQNLKNGSNADVTISCAITIAAENPEPSWFNGTFAC